MCSNGTYNDFGVDSYADDNLSDDGGVENNFCDDVDAADDGGGFGDNNADDNDL